MKSELYTLFLLTLFVVSCSEQQYFVKGTSTQQLPDGEYAYMRPMTHTQNVYIDSCRVVHGKFEMTGPLDSVQCVVISMGAFGIPLVLETGEVHISMQSSNIRVSGTPLNDAFYEFLDRRDSLMLVENDLWIRANDLQSRGYSDDYINSEIGKELLQTANVLDSIQCDFVKSNYNNVLGVSWFLQMCQEASEQCGHYVVPPSLEKVYDDAPPVFKSNWDIQNYLKLCK